MLLWSTSVRKGLAEAMCSCSFTFKASHSGSKTILLLLYFPNSRICNWNKHHQQQTGSLSLNKIILILKTHKRRNETEIFRDVHRKYVF